MLELVKRFIHFTEAAVEVVIVLFMMIVACVIMGIIWFVLFPFKYLDQNKMD